jgi:2-keto-4-pentenoate hydratase/2-oxohepta-3-ene-1,7-dioic acid hydratase in catechol pathway
MRLVTVRAGSGSQSSSMEIAGIKLPGGILTVRELNDKTGSNWKETVFELIDSGELRELTAWYNDSGEEGIAADPRLSDSLMSFDRAVYGPLYRNPKRIFGIGLNYVEHASDIGDPAPQGFPGSFFKMADTLIGPGDNIELPAMKEAQRTTADAELGIIIGKECRDVDEDNWLDVVAGYTTVLDMTEESILKGNDYVSGNPRYLTITKNFPTFFSFGPELVTPDEVPDVLKLNVKCIHNGKLHAENVVANMTHRPARLVSLHSQIQGWYPGDIISTGTPRAYALQDGDTAECLITGPDGFEMGPLKNPVIDLKIK